MRAGLASTHKDDDEFVAAIASRNVGQANVLGALARRRLEQRVPRLVPKAIVHLLEVVEIEKQHRKAVGGTVAARDLVRQPVAQHAKRREAGERVHGRLLLGDLRLALEVAGTGLQAGAPLRRRHRELLAGPIAARPRIPRPAVRREADLLEDLLHRVDRGPDPIHFDLERGSHLDLDSLLEHGRSRAGGLGRPDDGAAAEQLVLGTEQG